MSAAWQAALWLLALIVISVVTAVITAPPDEEDTMSDVDDTDRFAALVPPGRPEPLQAAASDTDRVVRLTTGLITAAVGYGSISAATGSLLTGLLGLLFAVAPIVASRVAAYRTADKARGEVTPVSFPAVVVDGVLTELVSSGRHVKES